MSTITIVDKSLQGEKQVWSLALLDETISLRELIRRRVCQEVSEYSAKRSRPFFGLIQPTDTELKLNGDRLKPPRSLDWQAQYEKAIAAFSNRGYIVFVGEMQVDHLDTSLELHADTQITFLRLVPLVGG